MTARDLAAEEAHAEFTGWMEAQGYPSPDDRYDGDEMAGAFAAGMQAGRDLIAAAPAAAGRPATSLEDAMLRDIDGLHDLVRDMLTLRWAPGDTLAQRLAWRAGQLHVHDAGGQPFGTSPAPGRPAVQAEDTAPGCTVCAQAGGPHGVPPYSLPAVPGDSIHGGI
jgi:hypothetical protein